VCEPGVGVGVGDGVGVVCCGFVIGVVGVVGVVFAVVEHELDYVLLSLQACHSTIMCLV
jgi:hypothetical protein